MTKTKESSTTVAPHRAPYHRIAEDVLVLTAGLGAGAGVMYLCAPKRGRARRGRLLAGCTRFVRRDERRMMRRAKDLLNRVGGLAAETASTLTREEPVKDEVLIERVRSRMGHVLSHPNAVRVHAKDGVVTLEGEVTHAARRRFRQELRTIAGAKRVNDCLTTPSLVPPGLLVGLAPEMAVGGGGMSQVAIYKCKNLETTRQTRLEHVEAIADSIRKRAFNIFQNRNSENGSDLDDWLQAERDLVWSPASELLDDFGSSTQAY